MRALRAPARVPARTARRHVHVLVRKAPARAVNVIHNLLLIRIIPAPNPQTAAADHSRNAFDRDFLEFNVNIHDLEMQLQAFISASFANISSTDNALSLLAQFQVRVCSCVFVLVRVRVRMGWAAACMCRCRCRCTRPPEAVAHHNHLPTPAGAAAA